MTTQGWGWGSGGRSWGRVRSAGAAVLVVVGLLLAPVAVVAADVRAKLTDTDRFVAAFGPLAGDAAVQDAVADAALDTMRRWVDFDDLATSAISSVTEGMGLPPLAGSALERLLAPMVATLRDAVDGAVRQVVSSDRFAGIWEGMLREAHQRAIAALEGDPDAVVALHEDTIQLQLRPVVAATRQLLVDQGIRVAALIPDIDRSLTLGEIPGLRYAAPAYRFAAATGAWLPWVAGALLVGGVALARGRRRTLVRTGIGLAVVMGLLLVVVSVAGAWLGRPGVSVVQQARATIRAAVYGSAVGPVVTAAIVAGVVGALVALVAWLLGLRRPAAASLASAR